MLAGGRGCAGSRQAGQVDRTADGEGGEEQRGATGLDVTSSSRQSFSQAILARRWSIIVLSVELCRALPCHFQLSMRCRPSRLPSLPPLAEGKASRQLESAGEANRCSRLAVANPAATLPQVHSPLSALRGWGVRSRLWR